MEASLPGFETAGLYPNFDLCGNLFFGGQG
jgi:hypothetical protein